MCSTGMTDYNLGEYAWEEILKGNIPEESSGYDHNVIEYTSREFWNGFREKLEKSIKTNKEK